MVSGDGFRLFSSGIFLHFGMSGIHRDTNKILGMKCELVDGGIRAQLEQ